MTMIWFEQAIRTLAAVESVEAFTPEGHGPPETVTYRGTVPDNEGTVVMAFDGEALMVAATKYPDDPEVVAAVHGTFMVWVARDGAILMATHSMAGRLFPARGEKARQR